MWVLNKAENARFFIGALSLVKEGLKNVEKIPGIINIEELQKISPVGTAHILQKVLN